MVHSVLPGTLTHATDMCFSKPQSPKNAEERLGELIDRYADAEAFDGDEADGPAGNGFGGPH